MTSTLMQVAVLLRTTLLLGMFVVVLAAAGSSCGLPVSPVGIAIGCLLGMANILSVSILVRAILNADSSRIFAVVITSLKLPILLLVVYLISQKSPEFIASFGIGFLLFIPTTLIAFRGGR